MPAAQGQLLGQVALDGGFGKLRGQFTGGGQHVVHETRRTTDIQVGIVGHARQHAACVEFLVNRTIVHMHLDLCGKCRLHELVEEGHAAGMAATVVHLERLPGGVQLAGHRQDGGHTDATRQQQAVRRWGEREVVLGRAHLQPVADLYPLVHAR